VPERMQLQGIAPVVRTLNALLAAATTPNQCVAARAAIEAAAAAVRVPTAATDERRIARRGGWRGGNEVETTEGGDAPPTLMYDVITFNTLLRAHARVGDVDGACSLLQEMRDNGFAPDAVSYTAVMQACTTVGDWVQAQALYDQVRPVLPGSASTSQPMSILALHSCCVAR
jgi:pentatricopeptide repeat protein